MLCARNLLGWFELGRRIGDDLRHEGPNDVKGDEAILAEALEVLDAYGGDPEAWLDWQDVKAELRHAEGAGEIPD